MTCKDCINDKLCDMWAVESGLPFVNPNTCEHFKNKADYVEVVRCRKCEYYEPIGNGKKGVCTHPQMKRCLKLDEDYCSLGFKTKE